MPPRHRARRRRTEAQCGLSLIELMVGITVGLVVAAAGAALLGISLAEDRKLLLEARLTQELRTASDLIARDLRRDGYWAAATQGVALFDETTVAANPYAADFSADSPSDSIMFRYSRDAASRGFENGVVDSDEQFGVRLRAGLIEMRIGASGWQKMTDSDTILITEFIIAPRLQKVDLHAFCPNPCPPGSSTCPPRQEIRSLAITLRGRLVSDPSVTRSLRSSVRLRNDTIAGACES